MVFIDDIDIRNGSDRATKYHLYVARPKYISTNQLSYCLRSEYHRFFFLWELPVRSSQNHSVIGIVTHFGPYMNDFGAIVISQVIKPKAILIFINQSI